MKIKSFLALSIGILCSIPSFAQRQQVSEHYNTPTGLPIAGKKTYSYIIGEDGENLKDGAFSIIAKPEALSVRKGYVTHKLSSDGYYKVNTTFKKGSLHGAFNFSYKITLTSQDIRGGATSGNQTATLVGAFSDGLPHGNFNITYKTDYDINLKAQYNKGVLVGAYSCSCMYDALPYDVNGTLSSAGELIGKWSIQNIRGTTTYEFQNGVLIRQMDRDGSTKPAVTELAKKFAAGTITEAELHKHSILVYEDSIPLGKYANAVALHNEVLDFDHIGGYDFSTPNNKRYRYLKEVSMFTEEGFEFYTQIFEEKLNAGRFDPYIKDHNNHEWGKINILDEGVIVDNAYLEVCAPYINAKGLKEHDYATRIHLTKEQEKVWEQKIHAAREQHAMTFGAAAANSRWLDRDLGLYFLQGNRTFTYREYKEIREEAVARINNGIGNILENFMLVPNAHEYLVEKPSEGREYNTFRSEDFIKKESVERDTIMIYLLAGKYDELIATASENDRKNIEEVKDTFLNKFKHDMEMTIDNHRTLANYAAINDYIEQKDNVVFSYDQYLELEEAAQSFIRKKDLVQLDFAPEFYLSDGQNVIKRDVIELIYVIAGAHEKLTKDLSASENDRRKIEEMRANYVRKSKEDTKAQFKPLFDILLNQNDAVSFANSENAGEYFFYGAYTNRSQYENQDLAKRLKPFFPISDYEIIGVSNYRYDSYGEYHLSDVECYIIKQTKRKTIKYKVTWQVAKDRRGNEKIFKNSIDINNATIVSEEKL